MARLPHPGNAFGQRAAVGVHQPGRFLHAHRVPQLERPQVPSITPAHGAVDVHDVVGDFRDAPRGILKCSAQELPQEAARRIVGFQCLE